MVNRSTLRNELFDQLAWIPYKLLTTFDVEPASDHMHATRAKTAISSRIERLPRAFGRFSKLPPEILFLILNNLDLRTAIKFRQTCRQANTTVDNLLSIRMLAQTPHSLPVLARFGMLGEFDTIDLCNLMKGSACSCCGQMGILLSLVTRQRCCYHCLRTNPSLWAVHGKDLWDWMDLGPQPTSSYNPQQFSRRYPVINPGGSIQLVKVEHALDIVRASFLGYFGPRLEWSGDDGVGIADKVLQQFESHDSRDCIKGWCGPNVPIKKITDGAGPPSLLDRSDGVTICRIAAVPLPAVREGRAVHGLFCRGCDHMSINRGEKPSRIVRDNEPPSSEWPTLTAYTEDEFLKHIEDCDGAHELVCGLDWKLAKLRSLPPGPFNGSSRLGGGSTDWFSKPDNWVKLSRDEKHSLMLQDHLAKLNSMDLPEVKSMPGEPVAEADNFGDILMGWFRKPRNWAKLSREERYSLMMQNHLAKLNAMEFPEDESMPGDQS